VNLVGFIIRIYHDARSPERQKTFVQVSTMSDLPRLRYSYSLHVRTQILHHAVKREQWGRYHSKT